MLGEVLVAPGALEVDGWFFAPTIRFQCSPIRHRLARVTADRVCKWPPLVDLEAVLVRTLAVFDNNRLEGIADGLCVLEDERAVPGVAVAVGLDAAV